MGMWWDTTWHIRMWWDKVEMGDTGEDGGGTRLG